jgi:hypothetical protein
MLQVLLCCMDEVVSVHLVLDDGLTSRDGRSEEAWGSCTLFEMRHEADIFSRRHARIHPTRHANTDCICVREATQCVSTFRIMNSPVYRLRG